MKSPLVYKNAFQGMLLTIQILDMVIKTEIARFHYE